MYDYGLELQISAVFPEADCSIFALLVNRLVINLTIPSSPVILLLPFFSHSSSYPLTPNRSPRHSLSLEQFPSFKRDLHCLLFLCL